VIGHHLVLVFSPILLVRLGRCAHHQVQLGKDIRAIGHLGDVQPDAENARHLNGALVRRKVADFVRQHSRQLILGLHRRNQLAADINSAAGQEKPLISPESYTRKW